MLDFPPWKAIWTWFITLVVAICALPSIVTLAGGTWPESLPSPKINLGLDLAGGSQILLEADSRQVLRQRLENMEESVRARLRQAEPRIAVNDISTRGSMLSMVVADPSQIDAAREQILPLTTGAGLSGQRDWRIEVVDGTRPALEIAKEIFGLVRESL